MRRLFMQIVKSGGNVVRDRNKIVGRELGIAYFGEQFHFLQGYGE
jgi:hypothetical protein